MKRTIETKLAAKMGQTISEDRVLIYFKELVEKKSNGDVIIEFMTNKETLDTPLINSLRSETGW
jgi:TRAP-type C4-dicarboxylate transport system substrate-binding protein